MSYFKVSYNDTKFLTIFRIFALIPPNYLLFFNPLKTVVMDVSGSIAANPRKDEYTFEFFENLLVQFEADTQVKLSIVSFSDSATLNLPLDFYSVEKVRDAVSDLIWVGQGRDFYENKIRRFILRN